MLFRHSVRVSSLLLFAIVCLLAFAAYPVDSWAQEGAAAPAAAAPAPAGQAPAPATEQSTTQLLGWLIKVSGIIGLFIFGLSIYFVAVVVQNILELRMSFGVPPETVAACESMIEQQNVQGMMEIVEQDDSYFATVLSAGLKDLKYGIDEAKDKLDQTAESLTARMERRISILAVLGTLGPMIGLLGTLKGMIAAFSAIALSGVNLEASKVAEAISEALVLTFEGVLLSIPAIFFYSFFRNRIVMISLEASAIAEDFLKEAARLLRAKSNVARS